MKRKQRTQILIEDQTGLLGELATHAQALFPIEILEEPHLGLMMSPVRESAQKSLFYLGEVLVTKARVRVNRQIGLGILSGEDYEKALHLAMIDVAYPLLTTSQLLEWDALLLKAEEQIVKQRKRYQSQLNKTKVSFDTMEV
ncbi:MAG: phosphonate C-P lyase system protein PhnG [Enterococcus sp.]